MFLLFAGSLHAQAWSGVIPSSRAVDWSTAGVIGGIPARTTICTTLTSSASVAQINAALAACPSGQTVLLSAGTYNVTGTIQIPSNVTLRGAGTLLTILNASGSGGPIVSLGSYGDVPYIPGSVNITSGATAGSTSIVVSSANNYVVGGYIEVTEQNDLTYVSNATLNGVCTWCDESTGIWAGGRVRGQIEQVTSVNGTTIGITPPLYSNYGIATGTGPALATPFGAAVPLAADGSMAGVENLQVVANNTGVAVNFAMTMCANCWIKGVFSNFADNDHVDVEFGYHDEIRDSYFTNAYQHVPGGADADVMLAGKSTGCLIENNIMERLHSSIILNWGAAGNVVGYNYTVGEYDINGLNVMQESLVTNHGAHPQFNLIEGNVTGHLMSDGFWGTSSNTTLFRNQARGVTLVAPFIGGAYTGRGPVNWAAAVLTTAYTRGITLAAYTTSYNVIDNVSGSADAVTATGGAMNNGGLAPCTSCTVPPEPRLGGCHIDSCQFNAFDFGYDTTSDSNGSGIASFPAGPSNVPGFWVGTFSTHFITGNWDIASHATVFDLHASGNHSFPASFYRTSKPAWFGTIPWPAIGSDVTGGNVDTSTLAGHVYAIPALACYNGTAKDSNGLLKFDPNVCYPTSGSTPPPAGPTNLSGTAH
jgi:hypothetical protein